MKIEKYNKRTYLILIIGIVLVFIGVVRYFYAPTYASTNLKTQLPTVADGSIVLILGIGSVLSSVYRLVCVKKILEKDKGVSEKEKKRIDKQNRLTGIR